MNRITLVSLLAVGAAASGNGGMARLGPKPLPSAFDSLPSAPGPIIVGKKGVVIAGDTLVYTISWGPGARATSYDVTRSVTATNGTWSIVADSQSGGAKFTAAIGTLPLPHTFSYTRTTLSHKMWVAATPWDSATFTVSIVSRNSVGVSSAVSASWTVKRKPGPPGPITIDSSLTIIGIRILPDSVKLLAGASIQFCGIVRFANGAYALRAIDKLSAECVNDYQQSIPVAQRIVSPSQQARADSVCVLWSATGGTIDQEPCSLNPAMLKKRGLLFGTSIVSKQT